MAWHDAIGLSKNRSAQAVAAGVTAILLSLILMTWLLRLDRAHLEIPFADGGDVLLNSALIKSLVDNGWVFRNPYLGAPYGTQFYDFPFYDNLSVALMKVIALFTSNYAMVMNLFFLLTFPLTALTSVFALRNFKVSYPSALVVSLLFAFLPYHFQRGEGHFFLSSYFVVPLMTMVILWVWIGDPARQEDEPGRYSFTQRQIALAVVICALVGSTVSYYTFFGTYFLCVAAVVSAIRFRSPKRVAWGLGAAALTFIFLLVNTSPTWLYAMRHGSNPEVAQRAPQESELYGLKLTHLLFPIKEHRVELLRNVRQSYERTVPTYEGNTATLGTVGDIGFIFLLGVLFCAIGRGVDTELLSALAVLTFSALLLGTMGGLGVVFSYLVNPQMRAYNRISIYIAFFSLFGVALLLDAVKRWVGDGTWARYLWYVLLGATLGLGILDQTSHTFAPSYESLKSRFEEQQDFVSQVESSVPPGSMIFEIPNEAFPEVKPIGEMRAYDELRGYLHSRSLRWSAGAMRGRPEALWPERNGLDVGVWKRDGGPQGRGGVDLELSPQALDALAFAGFSGIYIYRQGFGDLGISLTAQLEALLGEHPLESKDRQLVFFNLGSFTAGLRAKYTAEQWEAERHRTLAIPSDNSWFH